MSGKSPLGVFINCPFDSAYQAFFDAIVFTVIRCGFVARSAREIDDGAQTRIEKIMDLIEACPHGIHDISRTEVDPDSNLPRFNMPLELGIFLGARRFGTGRQRNKLGLILDTDKFRYQKFISDIAGQDIHAHGNRVEALVHEVRNFLRASSADHISGGEQIYADYLMFERDKLTICDLLELKPEQLTYKDLTHVIAQWTLATSSTRPPSAHG